VQVSNAVASSADLVAVSRARLATLVARTLAAVALRTETRRVVALRHPVEADVRTVRL